jgi:hypothetical protein
MNYDKIITIIVIGAIFISPLCIIMMQSRQYKRLRKETYALIKKLYKRIDSLEGDLLEVPELIDPAVKDDIENQVYTKEKSYLDLVRKYYET